MQVERRLLDVFSLPMYAAIYSEMHSTSFSGLKTLITSSRWKSLSSVPIGSGSGMIDHGASASMSGRQASTSLATESASPARASMRDEIVHSSTHCAISMPSGQAGSLDSSTMPAPTSRSTHSASEMSPALRKMAVVSMNEKVILCSPNRPRDTFE